MRFPLSFVPAESWHVSPRRFGAKRNGGKRLHAGCDLYAPIGTPVYAVADGIVDSFSDFYLQTSALTIKHGAFWIRYGELKPKAHPGIFKGANVREGDEIGLVGDLIGLDLAMVHFEMYSGSLSGPLTVPSNSPYQRRADLLDPTSHLDGWAMALSGGAGEGAPALRSGDSGEAVLAWQQRLLRQGYAMALDADFGPITDTATRAFQAEHDLVVTGIVGRETLIAMAEAEKY